MKTIKFNSNIFITKTDNESIVILDGENDEFWGMEGPLTVLIYDIFSNKTKSIEAAIESLLTQYKVTPDEFKKDLQDCFDTMVENGLAVYD